MAFSLSKQTAQKIVDTVKDVCGHDINFIDPDGTIFASTDASRIGDYHEIGKKVIHNQTTLEVESDDSFFGTHKGVNIPFVYNRECIAAIGISGAPDEVRQYAILAQKITSLILREQEIDSQKYGEKNQVNYILHSLITNTTMNHDYLMDFLESHRLSIEDSYRTVIVKLDSRYNPSNISLIQNHIYQVFDQIPNSIYTFDYPNEYQIILTEQQYGKWSYIFRSLADDFHNIIKIGIGNACALTRQYQSYEAANIAIRSLGSSANIQSYEDLDLEILLGGTTKDAQTRYLGKTLSGLDTADIQLLCAYFDHDMSLKETADSLFLHKNTLQYKLNRIHKLTGYNPRSFRDAVILYIAIQLQNLF